RHQMGRRRSLFGRRQDVRRVLDRRRQGEDGLVQGRRRAISRADRPRRHRAGALSRAGALGADPCGEGAGGWRRAGAACAVARAPVTRKSDLLELQQHDRPFGGFAATRWGEARRVFVSPGRICEPEGTTPDYWRMVRALFAAGFRRGDLVHNCFSYHFTPAGSMLETGAHALGCTVFPGGVGQTEQQVQAMVNLKPDGYVGTPSFLKIILEKADELGVKLPG